MVNILIMGNLNVVFFAKIVFRIIVLFLVIMLITLASFIIDDFTNNPSTIVCYLRITTKITYQTFFDQIPILFYIELICSLPIFFIGELSFKFFDFKNSTFFIEFLRYKFVYNADLSIKDCFTNFAVILDDIFNISLSDFIIDLLS